MYLIYIKSGYILYTQRKIKNKKFVCQIVNNVYLPVVELMVILKF